MPGSSDNYTMKSSMLNEISIDVRVVDVYFILPTEMRIETVFIRRLYARLFRSVHLQKTKLTEAGNTSCQILKRTECYKVGLNRA